MPLPNYSSVWAVYYDEARACAWVGGTGEAGYFAHDKATHTIGYHSIIGDLPAGKRDVGEVWRIMPWKNGLVFQCRQCVLLRSDKGAVTVVPSEHLIDCSAVVDGRLLVATKQGVFEVVNGQMVQQQGCETLVGKTIRSMLPLDNGTMVIATSNDGAYIYDGDSLKPLLMDITPFLKQNEVFCAAIQGKQLAFGTVHCGAVIKNLETGTTQYANMATGLKNNTGLYLGTNQGVYYLPHPIPNSAIPPAPIPVVGLSGQAWRLTAIDGTLLCGNDHGAYTIVGGIAAPIAGPEGTWNFIELTRHPGRVLACDYRSLYSASFIEDSDGTIWLSHWQKGIYHLWLSDDCLRVTKSERFDKNHGLLVDDNNILCRVDGKIYISSVDGFHTYDHSTHQLRAAEWLTKLFGSMGQSLNVYETPSRHLWAYNSSYVAVARPAASGYEAHTPSSIAGRASSSPPTAIRPCRATTGWCYAAFTP